MKMVKLSDFYPYDRNKGGIQELHHKIESKTLQYWGEDSGILIGITPIYKRRLWSEEVKVVNDKMTNMKTRTYEGVQHGDWDEDDYAFYGLPLFKATAVKYGWDNPIGEDSGRERKYDSQY